MHVLDESRRTLEAYRVKPALVAEHAAIERRTKQGGYGRRQIFELVQNGADALTGHNSGRIEVLLTESALYCANEGTPIDAQGADAILSSHVSMKRGSEIGRFGIGFKSVLAVSESPEFFSRSGSFGFRADEAAILIRQIVPNATHVPILRLAWPIDAIAASKADPILDELIGWATTVVRLRFRPGAAEWLHDDLRSFPAEFVLFSPHVGHLDLLDRTQGVQRQIRMQPVRRQFRLVEADRSEFWHLAAANVPLSDVAKVDAGDLEGRDSVPVVWAIQLSGRPQRGRFWAFFPTEYVTTLTGIVNAPWKTNEDRQNLLRGPFNEELIEACARLVINTLPGLVVPKDPARLLDLLPARDWYGWADQIMNNRIYDLASTRHSLPDQDGALALPATLLLHPPGLARATVEAWGSYPGRPVQWCHPSVETRERRLRAERLVGQARVASVRDWLEALVTDGSAAASIAALRVAALARADLPEGRGREIGTAKIVLTTSGQFVAPVPGQVFLSGPDSPADATIVDPVVQAHAEARGALVGLGVTEIDKTGELRALVSSADEGSSFNWERFWQLASHIDPQQVVELLRSDATLASRTKVLTLADIYRPIAMTMLPGPIVPGTEPSDALVTVDTGFHAGTLGVLRLLGVSSAPLAEFGSSEESWFGRYLAGAKTAYLNQAATLVRPALRTEPDISGAPFPGPLEPLLVLSDAARARFVDALAGIGADVGSWEVRPRTKSARAESVTFPDPARWLAQTEGRVRTALGLRRPADAVGRELAPWASVLPVADAADDVAEYLDLPRDASQIGPHIWAAALTEVGHLEDDAVLGSFYALAAANGVPSPKQVRARAEDGYTSLAPNKVTVVSDPVQFDQLSTDGVPTVYVPVGGDVGALVDRWGMRRLGDIIKVEVDAVRLRDDTPLVDEFPALRFRIEPAAQALRLARCAEILVVTVTPRGKSAVARDLMIHEGSVYWLDSLGDEELVRRLSEALRLDLTPAEIGLLASKRAVRERRELVGRIRRRPDLPGRLLVAVGADLLRRRVPSHVLAAVESGGMNLQEGDVARLALAMHGADTLREFRNELAERGLAPPSQWAGSRSARMFVRELGFPPEFAGREQTRRDPWLEVEGRPDLPVLHDFQELIAQRIRDLLVGRPSLRGLVSLPTGAGKTRVVVEALVRALAEGRIGGPILWIAQTDELCEQAVQTWGYVWRALGPAAPLRISRLWSSNEAEALEGGQQVVVATVAKLQGRVDDEAYAWLAGAACAVIDEAHGSTTPSYTEILTWLGLGRDRERDRCPLIGLTATPFRGTNVEETNRLVGRYNRNRLDTAALGDDPYSELQDKGVLSKVQHELLPGTDIELTPDELDRLRQTRLIPSGVEARVGADVERNAVLLESIKSLPADWPVLLYAASVDHAEVMAGFLTLAGISSAAISSRTPSVARRYFVEEFRAGRIRVLTNYAVLTEGFDAPAVRAVYVARPTFSPNLYQQMIGRGLRGPLNGGTEHCLVVNVADNVAQFGEELAFRQFEYLWASGGR